MLQIPYLSINFYRCYILDFRALNYLIQFGQILPFVGSEREMYIVKSKSFSSQVTSLDFETMLHVMKALVFGVGSLP